MRGPAEPKSAGRSAVRKKRAAGGKAAAMPGRIICAARPIPLTIPKTSLLPKASSLALYRKMTQLGTPPVAREQQFDWPLCDHAEGLVLGQLDNFLARNA